MHKHNFYKITTATPVVFIGNVKKNCEKHIEIIKNNSFSDLIVFPELSLTGYTCEDLFLQKQLQEDVINGIENIQYSTRQSLSLIVVGAPLFIPEVGSLRNCAVVIQKGEILGIVPKSYLPNYREFYENRWFSPAHENDPKFFKFYHNVKFGTNLLFRNDKKDVCIGIEICEDVWAPVPPSSYQALAGANILINLSASNEIIGKANYRRNFVKNQSAKLVAAYVYCSSGPSESTKDLVFGGHNIIGENGAILNESKRFVRESHTLTCDVDVEKLQHERLSMPGTFTLCSQNNMKSFDIIRIYVNHHNHNHNKLDRNIDSHPFVPSDLNELKNHCEEIFNIQTCGLAKRLEKISKKIYIGVSGGLDSTLALLIACKTYDMLGLDRKNINGITMPGFGTTNKTLYNAQDLMNLLGISQKHIDIKEMCIQTWNDMNYLPFEKYYIYQEDLTLDVLENCIKQLPIEAEDLVFENVQARIRTMILMSHGFVLGTGDLSELALGWCTYNGDHMSMYNVNSSIPKTLVKFLVQYIADNEIDEQTASCLKDIVLTPISPELLPHKDNEITQNTESKIGPYELHDFFLYHFIKNGFKPEKILFLASFAFREKYSLDEISKWLKVFYNRFFTQQFKRDCVPGGPKVGSVSLSPRGDWRMPTEVEMNSWVDNV